MTLKFENVWTFRIYDSDGTLVKEFTVKNLIPNEGLNDVLSKYLKGSSYTAGFFVGLVDNSGFTAFAAGDTAAQIGGTNGWTESQHYSQTTRQALTLGSVSGQSVNNVGNLATFTSNAAWTLKGAFIVTSNVKGGTSGIIFGESADPNGTSSISNGQTITVQVTVTASST